MTVVDEGRVRHLFTAVEAQQTFGIPAATVRSWARRKRIWSYGLTRRNEPMYDRNDLVQLRDKQVQREYNRSSYKRSRQVRHHRRDQAD